MDLALTIVSPFLLAGVVWFLAAYGRSLLLPPPPPSYAQRMVSAALDDHPSRHDVLWREGR